MAYSIVKPIGCYVYTHRKATTGEIFYVGKGTAERAWDRHGRSSYWRRVADKHGVVIQIEVEGLLEFEAHARERDLIVSLRAQGVRLANLTDGGEGSLNPSDETRAKLSAFQKGRPKSPEHAEKIRKSNTGKKRSEAAKQKLRDRVVSDVTKAKMSASGYARARPSEATRQKLAMATSRNWEDSEYRLKILNGTTGKKRDASFSEKMSAISRARLPMEDDVRGRIKQEMLRKWTDPEYRKRMKNAHAGKGWSEARRKAHEEGDSQRRSENARAARARLSPELRSEIASIAALAGKAARAKKRESDALAFKLAGL